MTTGEEGITSDLMVELCSSSVAEVEVGWTETGRASAGASDATAEGLLSTGILAEGSDPFWEPSVACLQKGGKEYELQTMQKTLVKKKITFSLHSVTPL